MSDSFADLWNSSAPPKPNPAPQKLGSISPNTAPKRPQHDVFSLLSSNGSSAPNSRSLTPSMTLSAQQQKPPPPRLSGGDAFSDLLGGTLAGGANNGAGMTIAERAAKVERERREQLLRHQQAAKKQAAAWDGLDSLAKPSKSAPAKPPPDSDDWEFGLAASRPTATVHTKPPVPSAEEDDWGLGDFASPSTASIPKSQSPLPPSRPQMIWDSDDFIDPPTASASKRTPSPPIPAHKRSNSPGDFDFGDREDGLLDDNDSQDEGDILGVLSKPVDALPRRSPPLSRRDTDQRPPPNKPPSRAVSPPPHILGQIVEMGFSVQQARIALASTDTGLDVQAALDTLLSNGAASTSAPPQPPTHPSTTAQQHPRSTHQRLAPRDTPSPSTSQQDRDRDINLQEQADRLLAQASEIGLSVFNRANAFWKGGKERVQKAYEERAAAVVASGSGSGSGSDGTGRPRWMQEAVGGEHVDDGDNDERRRDGQGFSDEALPQKPRANRRQQTMNAAKTEPRPQAPQKAETVDLFSAEPAAYASPFRRGKPKKLQPQPASTTPPVSHTPAPRVPSPIRALPRQNIISAAPSAVTQSARHKSTGTEQFKLGQYAAASTAYTTALTVLPPAHLLRVPLHNNRALARLRTGDYTGAVEDASAVLEIVGAGYHPARELPVREEGEGAGVDLGDAVVKALKRRAEAWEGREKWVEAGKDWETVMGKDWVRGGVRDEAVRGVGRCRRMVKAATEADQGEGPKPKPTTVPKPKPAVRRAPTQPSQALENLRSANDAAEAEDQARHEMKDSVDARLLAWKGGKETNIRALLGSLDTVLWPELGMQKVGMADLVSPGQVKIKYTKAIARLHPDKLNANNTTLEQRMIANGVFGALNEAWNAFKQ